jgi:Kelch motif
MIEFEDRLRRDLREIATQVPTSTEQLHRSVSSKIDRRETGVQRQRIVASVIAVVFAVAAVGLAVGRGNGSQVTELDKATPRTGQAGWAPIAEPLIEARFQHASVNIGGEVLVFGGYNRADREASGAAIYDPEDGRWRRVAEPPGDMHNPVAVWTGTEVLVIDLDGRLFAYDPARDSWDERAHPPLETGANGVTSAVWTGDQMMVLQGFDPETPAPPLLAYDPATDQWIGYGPPPVHTGTAVAWADDRLLVLGVGTSGTLSSMGSDFWSFRPDDGWEQLPAPPLDLWDTRISMYSVWTGSEFVVGGGAGWTEEAVAVEKDIVAEDRDPTAAEWDVLQARPLRDVAAWNPATKTWRRLPRGPGLSTSLGRYPDLWTGREVVTWIATDVPGTGEGRLSGGLYLLDPRTGTWRTIPPPDIGSQQEAPAVWTGQEIVIVSGEPTAGDPEMSGCCQPTNDAVALTP